MEQVLQMLNSIQPLSDDLRFYLTQTIKPKELKRNDYLFRAGHVCQHICFIEQGLLRCFYLLNGKEVTAWLMKEGDVITSVESFFDRVPSYEFIQAYEDCRIHYITHEELMYASTKFAEFSDIRLKLTEYYYIQSEKRLFLLRGRSAAEKIEYMQLHHPDLVKRLEQKDLASYLDISEVQFSKMKPKDLETKKKKPKKDHKRKK